MKLDIDRFSPRYIGDAAKLVAERYAAMRACVPALPERYENPAAFAQLLQRLDQRSVGAVALHKGSPVGFLVGFEIDSFRSFPTWFSPEWASGAAIGSSCRIYGILYQAMAEQWCRDGAVGHLVMQFPFDRDAFDGWTRLGFGMAAMDGVRALESDPDAMELESLRGGSGDKVVIRQATSLDQETIYGFIQGLHVHLASSPIYLRDLSFSSPEEVADKIDDGSKAVLIAEHGGEAAGYLEIGPASNDACTIIRDPGTASITGAFVRPRFREHSLGTKLLAQALSWASENGYARCAVDFETMNTPAHGFWTRYFDPVCMGMFRVLSLTAD